MKVDATRQRLLLELADADAGIARLEYRARNLPEDAELAAAATRLAAARSELVAAEIAAEDLDRDYRRIESEITGMRNREVKDSRQLTAGGLAPRALSELQHELAGLVRRRGMLEDDLLELMERQEAVGTEQDRAAATITAVTEDLDRLTAARDRALAEVNADRETAANRRAAVVAEVPTDLLALYERRRAQTGAGAGLLRQRRCGACRIEIDRGTLSRIAATAPDEVVFCEECGAILVRTQESGL
ncbi:MAG: C4-type zinc ribbon domain-containing protein [Gordonia sp. (in: high G+C Gram-positive bacteria)]